MITGYNIYKLNSFLSYFLLTTILIGCSQSEGISKSELTSIDDVNTTDENVTVEIPDDNTDVNENTTPRPIVIDGHTLPPDPGAAGKVTVLGIDSNNNGVRDDVEIWIYKRYQGKHQIVKEIAMQSGRAFQIILTHPENAKDTYHVLDAAANCGMYFLFDAKDNDEPQLINEYIHGDPFKEIQLNTKARVRAYLEYDHLLGGGVYDLPSYMRQYCDFNITQLLQEQ